MRQTFFFTISVLGVSGTAAKELSAAIVAEIDSKESDRTTNAETKTESLRRKFYSPPVSSPNFQIGNVNIVVLKQVRDSLSEIFI